MHNFDGVDADGVWARSLWSGENVLGGLGFVWPLVCEERPWRRWFRGRQRLNSVWAMNLDRWIMFLRGEK